jgi:hypothetical protein
LPGFGHAFRAFHKPVHALAYSLNELIHRSRRTFRFETHPPVGLIANEAGDIELFRDLQHCISKADTLNVSFKQYSGVINGSGHQSGVAQPDTQT